MFLMYGKQNEVPEKKEETLLEKSQKKLGSAGPATEVV